MTPSITKDAINAALGNLLSAMLPQLPASNIIVGQVNRVASPEGDFVVFWPLRRPRLATNVHRARDVKFTGSIAGSVMTVTEIAKGMIAVGQTVFGVGVAANTTIQSLGIGTGGIGTYNVSISQTVESETLSAGQKQIEQPTEAVYQCDVHGAASGDNSQVIAALWRDGFAVKQMAGTGVVPLYAEDPRQIPFETAAKQFEERWVIDLHMQIFPSLLIPAQYADAATVTLVDTTNLPVSD